MTRKRDVKKSEFVAVSDVESADYFDFVRNGQNFRILKDDLVNALGVSGSLQTRGEITAVPALVIIGDINYIRNVLGGAGISVVNSPQDGIQIDHNFTVDKTGAAVMINEGSSSPKIRSLVAGTGIFVTASGNQITIGSTEVPVSNKTINVYEEADFPTPVGGIITLEPDLEYKVQNDITTSNRFVIQENTVLSGADGTLVELEYTGVGNMLTAIDVSCKIKDLKFRCETGTLYNISSTTGAHRFRHYNGNVTTLNVGNIDNLYTAMFDNVSYGATGTGITFSGNFLICILNNVGMQIPSGTGSAIDLGTATFTTFQLFQGFGKIDGTGYGLTGLVNSGNINADGLGTIQNSKQYGTGGTINNISPYDDRWEIVNNSDVPNSFDSCLAIHSGATMVIAAALTPVIIGATWLTEEAHRFNTTIGGRFTYTGKGTHVGINATITADLVSGIDDLSFFFYINGVQITNSRITREFDSGNPGNISMLWETMLETNDYLEIWVQNDDTSVDITIVTAILRIRS